METKKSGYQKLKEENERLKRQVEILVLEPKCADAVQLRHFIRFQAKLHDQIWNSSETTANTQSGIVNWQVGEQNAANSPITQ